MNRIFDKTLRDENLEEFEKVFLFTRRTTTVKLLLEIVIVSLIMLLLLLIPPVIFYYWWLDEASDFAYYLIGWMPITAIAEISVLLIGYRELINLSELHILWTMKGLGYF